MWQPQPQDRYQQHAQPHVQPQQHAQPHVQTQQPQQHAVGFQQQSPHMYAQQQQQQQQYAPLGDPHYAAYYNGNNAIPPPMMPPAFAYPAPPYGHAMSHGIAPHPFYATGPPLSPMPAVLHAPPHVSPIQRTTFTPNLHAQPFQPRGMNNLIAEEKEVLAAIAATTTDDAGLSVTVSEEDIGDADDFAADDTTAYAKDAHAGDDYISSDEEVVQVASDNSDVDDSVFAPSHAPTQFGDVETLYTCTTWRDALTRRQPLIITTTARVINTLGERRWRVYREPLLVVNRQLLPERKHREMSVVAEVPDSISAVERRRSAHSDDPVDINGAVSMKPVGEPSTKLKPSSWASLLRSSTTSIVATTSTTATTTTTTSMTSVARADGSANSIAAAEAASTSAPIIEPTTTADTPQPPPRKTLADISRDYRVSFAHRQLIMRGLVNRGNMCYMIATLYPLLYCAPLYNLLRMVARHLRHSFVSASPLVDALIMFMQEFHEDHHANGSATAGQQHDTAPTATAAPFTTGDPFAPDYVYDALQVAGSKRFETVKGRQEDAEEFLGFLLDGMHEEFVKAQAAAAAASTTPSASTTDVSVPSPVDNASTTATDWEEVGPRNRSSVTRNVDVQDSPITAIFFGALRSVVRCPGRKDSVTIEPFHCMQLDISPDHVHHIRDAMINMIEPEQLEGYLTPDTRQPITATKQLLIERLPPILIIHLKRFVFDQFLGQTCKLGKYVTFDEILEVPAAVLSRRHGDDSAGSGSLYRLFAVVNHHGGNAIDGHYTCDVRRAPAPPPGPNVATPTAPGDATSWARVDDMLLDAITVRQVTEDMGGRSAYLLFYQKC